MDAGTGRESGAGLQVDCPLTPDPSSPFRGRGEDWLSVGSECGGVRGDHRTDSVAHLRGFA